MLTYEQNVKAILECVFAGHKDELIEIACKGICTLKDTEERKSKTGHWISHREHCENLGVTPSGLGAYEWCSNCDCGIDIMEWHRNHYNYCPNCGAKMQEVEE